MLSTFEPLVRNVCSEIKLSGMHGDRVIYLSLFDPMGSIPRFIVDRWVNITPI